MPRIRLFTVVLWTLLFASVGLLYDTTQKLKRVVAANQLLSEEFITGDAVVELVIDTENGNAYIRVNKNSDNIHEFPGACSPGGLSRQF